MRFLFKTYVELKNRYNKRYCIDNRMIKDIVIESENVKSATDRFKEIIEKEYYIFISKSAMKNKSAMYVDRINGESCQVGFVITGKIETEIENTMVYLDLWVEIYKSVFA